MHKTQIINSFINILSVRFVSKRSSNFIQSCFLVIFISVLLSSDYTVTNIVHRALYSWKKSNTLGAFFSQLNNFTESL